MKLFVNNENKRFIGAAAAVLLLYAILSEALIWIYCKKLSVVFLFLFLFLAACILTIYVRYLLWQSRIIKKALHQIEAYLDGDMEARIDCDYEGELYRLFHEINTMAAVLNAHALNGIRDKDFLKDTLSDISHQLKTPLAALNIYNGLLQNEAENLPEIKEFAELSEQEIDRIETLVQNLLKIARLDAGTLEMEKAPQNIPEMMNDIELHFSYRAKLEHKRLTLSGNNHIMFPCDRDWLIEAISNIVKNAFDHTKEGDSIQIEWEQFASIIQIKVKDTGCGIHPEDLHHIFKRFYRSRFLQDTQGIGLGLPLAKAIIKAHDGTIEVESVLGAGTTFRINFLIPTKL